MNIEKEYETIDGVKNEGVRSRCVTCCKDKIDKLYVDLVGVQKDNIEMILYQRKSTLILELKWRMDVRLNFMITIFGAFLGVYVSYIVTHIITGIIDGIHMISHNMDMTDPMQIIYSNDNMIFFFIHFMLVVSVAIVGKLTIKRSNDKVDRQFYEDMSKYELGKIDELLNNM